MVAFFGARLHYEAWWLNQMLAPEGVILSETEMNVKLETPASPPTTPLPDPCLSADAVLPWVEKLFGTSNVLTFSVLTLAGVAAVAFLTLKYRSRIAS